MYKILIVDDEPLVQVGIKSMLNCQSLGLEICGVAANGEAALEIIESDSPNIVICDIKMPIMSGLELIKICCERYGFRKPVFIFLTSYEEFAMAKEALTYQASDYLIKLELTPDVLDDAIKRAIERIPARQEEQSTQADTTESEQLHYNEKFYLRLLQNMFDSPEQLKLQSEYLGINFNSDAYQCIYIEFFDHTNNNLSKEKLLSLFTSASNLLHELIVKYFPAEVVPLDVNHCAVIVRINQSDGSNRPDISQIMEALKDIQASLRKYYNIIMKAGIGSIVTNPIELSESYQYARQAYSFISDDNSFMSIDECQTTDFNHRIFNLAIFRDQLKTAFEEFDEVVLSQTIDELNAMFSQYPQRNLQALDAACSILYMSISSIPGGEQTVSDMFSDYPDGYRSIYHKQTTEQITTWLELFKNRLCDYFISRKNNHTNHTVNLVKRYIAEHICDKLTLNDVSYSFNITPNYLSQLFKKHNDLGFNEYVTSCKINEAKRLMSDSSMKIYEISDKLGFESSFYFSKVFKKKEGVSPKEYINQKMD